jgi:hypothetical protein
MRIILILTLGTATLGLFSAAAGSGAVRVPPRLLNQHPCAGMGGFTCSTLTVPLDRSGRIKGTLQLNVAAADNTRADRGILLFLTGGPGQPGVGAIGRVASRLTPLLAAYRL